MRNVIACAALAGVGLTGCTVGSGESLTKAEFERTVTEADGTRVDLHHGLH